MGLNFATGAVATLSTSYAGYTTVFYDNTSVQHSTVPAGKRWVIVGACAYKNGSNLGKIYASDTDESYAAMLSQYDSTNHAYMNLGGIIILEAGYKVSIVYCGMFTYYEVNA